MSQDEVKKLLGEPPKVSVSRFYATWYYLGGTVTFDGKGRLDSWTEI
jgi:outer membrane protein assembly factor BamE (lipoprotein component of BamABCDE complex)